MQNNKIFFGLSGLALVLAPFVCAQAAQNTVTVVTYNLANYNDHGRWPERLDLLVKEIKRAHADVIVLQEDRYDPDHLSSKASHQDMSEQILYKLNAQGEFLGAAMVTQPIMYYPHKYQGMFGTHNFVLPAAMAADHQPYYWEGLSIISKLKILETGSVFLTQAPGCKDDNKRATQYVRLDNHGEPLYIANVHFSGGPQCAPVQVKETLDYLRPYLHAAPLIIAGDFNISAGDPLLARFDEAGLTDAWRRLHPGEIGYTGRPDKPIDRIDYIWVNSFIDKKLRQPSQVRVIGTEAQNGVYPSDHMGVSLTW